MPENSNENRHYNKPVSNEYNKNDVQFVNNLNNQDEIFDHIRDQVRYCIQTVLKEVKEDDKLVTQIFYVMLSAYSNDPCNLAINAPPGEGKTYNLQKVGNLFPQNDITFISYE